jgi:asparagine synthase (glutamine-hydrolysing)
MCGIAGCLALAEGARPDTDWVRRATARQAHRGPDDVGFFTDPDLGLGFRRLAVVELGARQPAQSVDGRYVLVVDGEVYNYAELASRLRLRGVPLRTGSVAEVLVEMYAWLGREVVRELRGMYAFVVWDRRNRELFCARDPFGIKPLFYALTSGSHGPQLRFASERKALAGAGEISVLDPDALRRYLSFQYVPAPATLTPPARSLPPGHVLIARPGGSVDVYRYWRPEFRPSRSPSAETPAKILDALRDSVGAHMRSDVPVGAFLSGGIDSASLCALAAEVKPDLMTFTVGFERAGYSEIDLAQETATALGVKSVPYVITPNEFVKCLPEIIWHLDDPMADASAVPLWFAAREARRQVKVVLSGEGADEVFGGYKIYYQRLAVRMGKVLPGPARSLIGRAAAAMPAGSRLGGLLDRTVTPLPRRYIGNAYIYRAREARELLAPCWGPQGGLGGGSPQDQGGHRGGRPPGASTEFDVTDPVYRQASRADRRANDAHPAMAFDARGQAIKHRPAAEPALDDVATMQLVDVNTWLPGDILVKADRVSQAHGLELRTPFLDREVMAVASRLARVEKTAAGTTKFALREAVSPLLPQAVDERAKLGFPVPIGHWLEGGMYGYAEQVIRTAQTGQWIDQRAALDVLRRFRAGDPGVTWRHVWLLVVFSLWHQIYVERAYDPVALGWTTH